MRILKLALTLSLMSSPVAISITPSTNGCTAVQQATTGCSQNTGTEIVVDGTHTTPGSPGTSPVDDSTGTGTPYQPRFGQEEFDFGTCLRNWDDYIGCFRAIEDDEEMEDEDDASPGMPAVTIADVARFAPDGTLLAGEPENVGVAGLPTNFVATASAHTVDGTLFGYPISVRFTPVGYDFDFGDGSSASTAEGGRSWADLGQAQFTPTPTSHTYAERGEYIARVDVRYTAEVDLGVGWFPLSGELTASGDGQRIRVFEAHTALVAQTCEQSPSSPGC